MPGTLYVVATPIGNLEDITLRALRILREVDLIAAEDTRRTAKLLARHNIQRPMVSLHAHNEGREAPKLVDRLAGGISIALVSDAGTPGISDPGEYLVRLAREGGLPITPIPGPSAITAALSVSGLPASEFVFMGFPPRGGSQREAWMQKVAAEPRTVVAFEAPHRVQRTVTELISLAIRPIQVHREISKIHENLVLSPIMAGGPIREQGEIVLVIAPVAIPSEPEADASTKIDEALEMFGCMTTNDRFSRDRAVELISRATGISQAVLRKAVKKARIADKRRAPAVS